MRRNRWPLELTFLFLIERGRAASEQTTKGRDPPLEFGPLLSDDKKGSWAHRELTEVSITKLYPSVQAA